MAITSDRQFWYVIRYIHQNPQKHGFVDDFRYWNHFRMVDGIILTEGSTPLKREKLLDWFGGKDEYHSMHADWVNDARSKWFAGDDFD